MDRRIPISIMSLTLVAVPLLVGCAPMELTGEVRSSIERDTLRIDYDLEIIEPDADSVTLALAEKHGDFFSPLKKTSRKIYDAADTLDSDPSGRVVEDSVLHVRGKTTYPYASRDATRWYVVQRHSHFFDEDSIPHTVLTKHSRCLYPNGEFGYMIGLGAGVMNRDEIEGTAISSESGLVPMFDYSVEWFFRKFTLGGGVHVEGDESSHGAHYNFNGGGRYFPNGRQGLQPVLSAAAVYEQFDATQDEMESRDKGTGVELGIGLQSNFETLTYRYATPMGGVHTVDLLMASSSGHPGFRWGTLYSVTHGRDFTTYSIRLYANGPVKLTTGALPYPDHRPFWRKALSSLISLPMQGVLLGLTSIGLLAEE